MLDADEIPNEALGDDSCKKQVNSLLCSSVMFPYSAGLSGLAKELLSDFADSLPGIDEAKSFMQVMGYALSSIHC